jgi:hypothetical protein
MSWPSDAVPDGGAQNSNRSSLKSRTNPDEFRQNLEEFRADGRNSEEIQGKFRPFNRKFRGNLEEIWIF